MGWVHAEILISAFYLQWFSWNMLTANGNADIRLRLGLRAVSEVDKTISWNGQCLCRRRSPHRRHSHQGSCYLCGTFPEGAVTVLYLPYGPNAWAQLDVLPLHTLGQTLGKLLGASLWMDKYGMSQRCLSQGPPLQGCSAHMSADSLLCQIFILYIF